MIQSDLIVLGVAQVNTTVGEFEGNTGTIMRMMKEMSERGVGIAAFNECAINGYPSEDLSLWTSFHDNQARYVSALVRLSGQVGTSKTIFVVGGSIQFDGRAYNVAYVFGNGLLLGVVPKTHLPEYSVHFDKRVYSEGKTGRSGFVRVTGFEYPVPFGDLIFVLNNTKLAISICEDIWTTDILQHQARAGAEFAVNISSSPFRSGAHITRYEMLATRSGDTNMALAYTSQIGGQGGLTFDGDWYLFSAGRLLARAKRFQEGWASATVSLATLRARRAENTTFRSLMDADDPVPAPMEVSVLMNIQPGTLRPQKFHPFIPEDRLFVPASEEYYEDLLQVLTLGLHDYIVKTKAFDKVGINSSGGRDSALVAVIAWLAANRMYAGLDEIARKKAIRAFVNTFSLPTRFNKKTKKIARMVGKELGIGFKEIPIEDTFAHHVNLLKSAHPKGWVPPRLTLQNIQAEIRGHFLSMWCGANRAAFLNTGNMTERAFGYFTKRGDGFGDLAVIGNIPKTVVNGLLKYLGKKYHWKFIDMIFEIDASAELEEGQWDEQELGPFEILDTFIDLCVGDRLSPIVVYETIKERYSSEEMQHFRQGYEPWMLAKWIRSCTIRLFVNVHKWVTSPESLHSGRIDLDRERATMLPTVMSLNWLQGDLSELEKLGNQPA